MNVLFLDIDGVLNSQQYLSQSDLEDKGIYRDIDSEKVALLRHIVDCTGVELVLSSSWRTMLNDSLMPLESSAKNFLTILSKFGLTLYDKTPCLHEQRGDEIRMWLAGHAEVCHFVILDDENFEWGDLKDHWIKTSYYNGLTEKEVEKVIIFFLEGNGLNT